MNIREVTNPAAILGKSTSRTSYSGADIASAYADILAEKISNIKADVQAMAATQEQLDEIADLQEELTGTVKVDEDSGNANRSDSSSTPIQPLETIKRFMPDGSIMVTTYKGSKIVEQVKHKPHMVAVPDYTAPPKPDGNLNIKLEARQNYDLEMLLMM